MQNSIYSAGFVVSILVDGKPISIQKNNEGLTPFNSEYKIKLQNKNYKRALAKVFIDDENISDGGFIVNGQSSVIIENPVNKQYAFKFVSIESGQAVDSGKTKYKDGRNGVIRVEWELERDSFLSNPAIKPKQWPEGTYPEPIPFFPYPTNPWRKDNGWQHPYKKYLNFTDCGSKSLPEDGEETYCNSIPRGVPLASFCNEEKTSGGIQLPKGETGCTVSGSVTNQTFRTEEFITEGKNPVIILLVLKGYNPTAHTTSEDSYCSNCGKKITRKSDKFCGKCGNRLSQ